MAFITYRFVDGHCEDIEVTEEFAAEYEEMEHKGALIERKETRRHQSLDKSLEHGFDILDPQAKPSEEIERRELSEEIRNALHKLTDKQRRVVLLRISDGMSFREIGEKLGLGTYTVRDYFYNAVKKLQKFLSLHTPKRSFPWLLGEGLRLYLKNGRSIMLTLKQIRDDLKDIRYYYSRKEAFEQGFRVVGSNDIVGKAKRYNTVMQSAPTRLYDIYVCLYARNLTQEALSIELCYTPEYIQILNKRLLLYLQKTLSEERA